MNTKAAIGISIFLVIVAGMFAFAYVWQSAEEEPQPNEQVQNEEDEQMNERRITAKHFYIDGTHTLAGEIAMPTPCDLLEADATVAESSPEQVTIDFSVINNSEGQCAQVITPQRFKVSFDASEEAEITARFNGEPAILNLIEAAEGETPEDFELFIKG